MQFSTQSYSYSMKWYSYSKSVGRLLVPLVLSTRTKNHVSHVGGCWGYRVTKNQKALALTQYHGCIHLLSAIKRHGTFSPPSKLSRAGQFDQADFGVAIESQIPNASNPFGDMQPVVVPMMESSNEAFVGDWGYWRGAPRKYQLAPMGVAGKH